MKSLAAQGLPDTRPGVVLLRNSTGKQVDNPRSLKAEEIASKLLEERGIEIGAILDEQGTSGADLRKRPVAQKLVDELEAGKWSAISVIEVSRTSRDPDGVDQRIFKRACKRGHALLLTPTKAYDFRNDADDLQYEVEAIFSAQEWKKLRKRSFEGNIERAKIAPTFFGFAPFGYRPVLGSITIRGTTRGVRLLEKNPDHAPLMAAIAEALEEEEGLQAAAWRLNAAGWTQPNGSMWYWSQVERVLTSPIYVGRYEYGRLKEGQSEDLWRDVVEAPEHILPELAWYDEVTVARWRAKLTGKAKGRTRPRLNGHPRPLLGILRCRRCREPMVSAGMRGYGCSRWRVTDPSAASDDLRSIGRKCKGQHLSAPQAERAVRDLICSVLPDLAEVAQQVRSVLEMEELPDFAAELRQIDRAITARLEISAENRANGITMPADYMAKTKDLQDQRDLVVRRMEDTAATEAERRHVLQQAARFVEVDEFLAVYDRMKASEQRATLRELLDWVVVETNGGRGHAARAWVADYQATFPKSDSGLESRMSWLSRFDRASVVAD
jgi:DNA invertase Pin-like site-specific DNA recombinase